MFICKCYYLNYWYIICIMCFVLLIYLLELAVFVVVLNWLVDSVCLLVNGINMWYVFIKLIIIVIWWCIILMKIFVILFLVIKKVWVMRRRWNIFVNIFLNMMFYWLVFFVSYFCWLVYWKRICLGGCMVLFVIFRVCCFLMWYVLLMCVVWWCLCLKMLKIWKVMIRVKCFVLLCRCWMNWVMMWLM